MPAASSHLPPTNLREAHAHIAMHGRALSTLRLHDCTSVDECLERVRAEAARLDTLDPAGSRWLQATGVRTESWRAPRWPTRDELDRACPNRPASLMSFDHHALVANTPAFQAAAIADNDADPEGGVIVRDPSRGNAPTGLLLEAACWKVRTAVPEPVGQERFDVVQAALRDLAALGFVEVHDLLAPAWLGETLATLHDRGELTLRVGLYAPLAEVESQCAASSAWRRPGHVELLGGKIFVDGTLNARTAWMLTPYRGPLAGHPSGTPLMSVAQIAQAIWRCDTLGVGLAAHAIGDGAVRAVLDAAALTSKKRQRGTGGQPSLAGASSSSHLRIEHAEIIDERDVSRFAELGVVASLQPCHLLYDIEVLERQLPHRLDRVLPIRELIACGLEPGRTLLFGSDTPIVRPNPSDSVLASVHRRRTGETPGGPATARPIAPAQAIDAATAWACFSGVGLGMA